MSLITAEQTAHNQERNQNSSRVLFIPAEPITLFTGAAQKPINTHTFQGNLATLRKFIVEAGIRAAVRYKNEDELYKKT